ncbi:hypothetical protein FQR65_LT03732 [Abscondita terminalis]|nr:hypothetical protein FQR65_LT03732 [Abscondita terminalis]
MLLVIFLFPFVLSNVEIPSYFHLCKKSDPNLNECIRNSALFLRPYVTKGIPEMKLIPIDPLHIPYLSAHIGQASAIAKLELVNTTVYGLSGYDSTHVHADISSGRFSTTFIIPEVRIEGNYKISGKILNFDLDGKGFLDFNATDLTIPAEWFGDYTTKNDQLHLIFNHVAVKVNIKSMSIYFYDLFEDNDDLTRAFNKAINDNIHELKEELDAITQKIVGDLITDYFNGIYEQFPIDTLYPD